MFEKIKGLDYAIIELLLTLVEVSSILTLIFVALVTLPATLIEYLFEREEDDEECDKGRQEVSFVEAWARRVKPK